MDAPKNRGNRTKTNHETRMEKVLYAMRAQAWERAKAEMETIRQIDFPPEAGGRHARDAWEEKCDKRAKLMADFIKAMDDGELYV